MPCRHRLVGPRTATSSNTAASMADSELPRGGVGRALVADATGHHLHRRRRRSSWRGTSSGTPPGDRRRPRVAMIPWMSSCVPKPQGVCGPRIGIVIETRRQPRPKSAADSPVSGSTYPPTSVARPEQPPRVHGLVVGGPPHLVVRRGRDRRRAHAGCSAHGGMEVWRAADAGPRPLRSTAPGTPSRGAGSARPDRPASGSGSRRAQRDDSRRSQGRPASRPHGHGRTTAG